MRIENEINSSKDKKKNKSSNKSATIFVEISTNYVNPKTENQTIGNVSRKLCPHQERYLGTSVNLITITDIILLHTNQYRRGRCSRTYIDKCPWVSCWQGCQPRPKKLQKEETEQKGWTCIGNRCCFSACQAGYLE